MAAETIRSTLVRFAGRSLLAFLTFFVSCWISLWVERGMARFVYHDAFDHVRYVLTLVGILYVDVRMRVLS